MGGEQSTSITTGLPGFLVVFLIALVCWFLFRDMSKRLRSMRRSSEDEDAQQKTLREQAELVARAPEASRRDENAAAPDAEDSQG